jgi:enolase-phosphatase E1
MIKLYLFDIEGTTTDINFVHKVLFPYAEERLRDYILIHQDDQTIQAAIKKTQETVLTEQGKVIGLEEAINALKAWIHEDRKHPALKEVQGLIWDEGYKKGHFKGHLYPDVAPFFEKIHASNAKIGIYSSGSVHAQKLIFGYSTAGNLTPLISCYFDTKVGHKREKSSYQAIAKEMTFAPTEIHFFSDIPQELEAAQAAGLKITHVRRENTLESSFPSIESFEILAPTLFS